MQRITIRVAMALLTAVTGLILAGVWTARRAEAVARGEVLRATNALHRAVLWKDGEVPDQVLADDLTVVRRDNSTLDKARLLVMLKSDDFAVDSINADDLRVDVDGDRASVAGEVAVTAHFGGREPLSHSSRLAYSYEQRQGGWRLVSIRALD